jgi:hypothetical protein
VGIPHNPVDHGLAVLGEVEDLEVLTIAGEHGPDAVGGLGEGTLRGSKRHAGSK